MKRIATLARAAASLLADVVRLALLILIPGLSLWLPGLME